jgi:hypothetical protein
VTPDVQRNAASPALPQAPSVVLRVDPGRDPRAPLLIHGAFHLPIAAGDAIGHPVHHGIVVVVWSPSFRYAAAPFRDQVLFADDEVGVPGGIGGFFNVDLFELQGDPAIGDFHIFATLGEYVSNVVRASVR